MRLAICIFLLFFFSFSSAEAGERKKSEFLSYLAPIVEQVKEQISEETGEEVDIPTSLVLAQAALESGWGKRHPKGNLFGLTNGKGKTRKFHSVEEGTRQYILNLLSHDAYEGLRGKIESGIEDPILLAKALGDYSENPSYVRHIQSIIRVNRLGQYDSWTNRNGGPWGGPPLFLLKIKKKT